MGEGFGSCKWWDVGWTGCTEGVEDQGRDKVGPGGAGQAAGAEGVSGKRVLC